MGGSLGEKIGEGAFADVHVWAPGQVLKLFRAGISRRIAWHEARMTRAVFAAGGPALEVLDEVTLDGRFGIVLPHLEGPTLLHLSRTGAMSTEETGAILAPLYMSVHKTTPPPDVLSLYDWMAGSMRIHAETIPKHISTGVLNLIERLSPGDGLCHCDLNSGNVIMTAQGPRIIDWTGAVRAPAALDLGCGHVVLTELAPERVNDPERPRAVNTALQSEYARLAGMSSAALATAVEAYLPIARVFAILGPAPSPALREILIQRVEAALR
ncbi:phosphotransferase [Phenylobacterium sp.]|uniref:phosphotransferase n=1 Tax=Phenylobacterium sp. TaxID=1871053 RepID=UPI002F419355